MPSEDQGYLFVNVQLPDSASSERTQAVMRQWLQANRREDRNPHHYTLEQFGFTRTGLERDFKDYRETFLA